MTAGIAAGGWPDERTAWLLGAILNNPGLALLVSGLSPYLPQGFPERAREDNGCLRGSEGLRQAGQEGQFSIDLELLAVLIIFGFVCWGGAEWIARR
ncbi:MAG: hypothetical protein WCF30_04870 [Terracidiphilus sp.]